jgi:hypothetical protein
LVMLRQREPVIIGGQSFGLTFRDKDGKSQLVRDIPDIGQDANLELAHRLRGSGNSVSY